MIKKLASPACMKTDPKSGTNSAGVCQGVQRYVESCGYVCKSLEYRGWRPIRKSMAAYAKGATPSLEWIKRAAADGHTAVWLNLGWYVNGNSPDEWKRQGGHWVAVIGYGTDALHRYDPNVLLVANPAIRSAHKESEDAQIATDVVNVAEIERGLLVGTTAGLPHNAAGLYRVSGPGVGMSKKYNAAIIDGVVVLVVGDHR